MQLTIVQLTWALILQPMLEHLMLCEYLQEHLTYLIDHLLEHLPHLLNHLLLTLRTFKLKS